MLQQLAWRVFLLLGILSSGLAPSKLYADNSQTLQKVEANLVCMMNDTYFGRPQIPVEVNKKTYYGCCEHCKAALVKDQSVRVAKDPVSSKTVDKANAVIGAANDGRVWYFENEANLKAFQLKQAATK